MQLLAGNQVVFILSASAAFILLIKYLLENSILK
jgi:hypothetical protein